MCKLNMKPNRTRGYLITFCGLDGCGKSTIIKHLERDLKKRYQIFLTKQPTDFVRKSDIFRTYMDSPEHDAYDYRSLSLLAASDRVQHTNKVIVPAMDMGKVVISDRYFYSCLANLHARGFEKDRWINEISEFVIEPDIAFFLDIPVDIAVARVRSRPEEKERYIDMDLQYRLRQEYIDICAANRGFLISTENSPEQTYSEVLKIIRTKMEV